MQRPKDSRPETSKSPTPSQIVNRFKKPEFEVRLTRRLQLLRDNPSSNPPIIPPSDGEVNLRAIPVEGKIITQETYLFPDYLEEANLPKIPSTKHRAHPQSHFLGRPENHARHKSALIDKSRPNAFGFQNPLQKSILGNSILLKPGHSEPPKDHNYSISLSSAQNRPTDTEKSMETRRQLDHETISLLGESQNAIELPIRKKDSLSNLLDNQFWGPEEFFEGTLIKGLKTGFCRVVYSSLICKEGLYQSGHLEGEGTLKFPNGIIVQGVFKANVLFSHINLSLENQHYTVGYHEGDYHNDQIYANERGVLFVTAKICENIEQYSGKIKVYFRNGFKLDSFFEKGLLSESSDSLLFDRFGSGIPGKVRHGINPEVTGIYAFRPFAEPENEYLLFFKGEGSAVRKHRK